ncbi:hypothetical protein MMC24_006403 [Lignoscripta atroalba]|nr:hypothetical protein [Lignoscripta atroalba]
MPPPPPPKRIKRPAKVLDEDTYTDALSHIIARDFFPGLMETESQQEYLNALDSQDSEWIAAAGRKLTEVMTPGPDGRRLRGRRGTSMTPTAGPYGKGGETPQGWGGDTPMSMSSTTSTATTTRPEKPSVDTNMSLSAFQTKYTSEDNESFYKLLDKQNLKKAEKHAWMWAGNKIPSARQIAHRNRESRLLADRPASQEADQNGKQNQNQQQQLLLTAAEASDTRKAMPDSWPCRPANAFMFAPSSIEDSAPTVQQKAEDSSRAPPKAVIYDNTRLAAPTTATSSATDAAAIPPSPSLSAIQDALSGRPPRPTASEPGFSSSGSETPRVNGYAFVDSREPSPSPADMRSRWGNTSLDNQALSILGAGGDGTPNPFKIREGSKREALHHRMVDRVARGKRAVGGRLEKEMEMEKEKERESGTTPVPRFASSPHVGRGGLTPAAKRLLGKVGGGGGSMWEGRTPKVGSGLRVGWTPKGQAGTGSGSGG